MNKKGFVLLETIVVLLFTVVAMLGLFNTYSFVFKGVKQSRHYDNINDVYKLNIFYKILKEKDSLPSVGTSGFISITPSNCASYFDSNCSSLYTKLGFDKIIYTNLNLNNILNNPDSLTNTDINYIEKLEQDFIYLIGVYEKDGEYYYVSLKAGDL